MAATYHVLAAPNDRGVLNWFGEQPEPPQEFSQQNGVLLYFSSYGELALDGSGEVDVQRSPVVSVLPSRVRRQALWTVGEVHFLAKGKALEAVRRAFLSWLRSHELVWDQASDGSASGHYLEGGVRNVARQIYALPSGLDALTGGQFFVAEGDNEVVLDRVCKSLRLQGIDCASANGS